MSTKSNMTTTTTIISLALLLATLPVEGQPNILLWMVDDASYRNYSFGGGQTQTFRLKRTGEQGINYKKAWSNAICRPTRAMLMTGQYATETGWWGQNHPTTTILGPDFGTFGNLAKSQGYRTLMVGKWQLDGNVLDHGFDHYCLWEKSDIVPTRELREQFVEESNGPVFDPEDRGGKRQQNRYWHPLIVRHFWPKQHEMLITTPEDFGPNIFVQCIEDFLKVNKSQPFFIYWAGTLTHQHWDDVVQDQAFIGMPEVKGRNIMDILGREPDGTGSLKSNIDYTDKIAGYLRKILRENGHFKNTIFAFTADNTSHGFGKGQLRSESGVHVPLVVWGGPIKKRGKDGALFSLVDMYNTFSDLMGAGVDSSRPNSYSWAKYWTGESDEPVRKWMIAYRGEMDENGVIQPKFIARTAQFIRDAFDVLWDCSGGRDESSCNTVNPSNPEYSEVYQKLGQKIQEIRETGYSDATKF